MAVHQTELKRSPCASCRLQTSSRHETAEGLLRPYWKRLEAGLNPDIISRRLYSEKILSLQEVEEIQAATKTEGRTSGVVKLLMKMATRSRGDGLRLAEILTETPGMQGLGRSIQQGDMGCGRPTASLQESREVQDAAAEESQLELRERVNVLESKLYEKEKTIVRQCLMETALRLKRAGNRDTEFKHGGHYGWKQGPIIPDAWDYMNRIVYSQNQVLAAYFLHPTKLYSINWDGTELSSEWCEVKTSFEGLPFDPPNFIYNMFKAGEETLGSFGTISGNNLFQFIAVYKEDTNIWQHAFKLPFHKEVGYHHIIGDQSGKAYVIGGRDTRKEPYALDTLLEFDLRTGILVHEERMKSRRTLCSSAIVDNRLFVAGGDASLVGQNTTEVMSLVDYSWRQLADTPSYRSTLGLLCDRVISSGGTVSSEPTEASRSVSVLDTSEETWLPLPSMTVARDLHGLVTLDYGTVLAVGGMQSFGCVDRLSTVELLQFS